MDTKNIINEALQIMKAHDWTWFMADFGYTQYYEGARANMRHFVSVISKIDDAQKRDALRELWTLKYYNTRASVNGQTADESKESELMQIIAA